MGRLDLDELEKEFKTWKCREPYCESGTRKVYESIPAMIAEIRAAREVIKCTSRFDYFGQHAIDMGTALQDYEDATNADDK